MAYYLSLLLAVVVWGIEYPLYKRCTEAVGFLATGAVMFSVAAGLLGLMLSAKGRARNAEAVAAGRRIPFGRLLLIGLIGFTLNGLALAAAQHTSVVNVSTLARTDVLFSLLLSVLVFRETVDARAFLFLPVMAAGVCLLTGMIARSPELGRPGDYLILASALLVALNAFVIKAALRDVRPTMVGFCNSATIAVCFLVAAIALGDPVEALVSATGETWAMAVSLGVMACVFFAAYNTALNGLPVWEVRLCCLGIPVVATLTGWVWLSDVPTPLQWLGMLGIGAGAAGVIVLRSLAGSSRRNSF